MAVNPITIGRPNCGVADRDGREGRTSKQQRPCALSGRAHERGDRREEDRASPAMVHVSPHCRQRQSALSEMTLASVSMILPLQNGHAAGRVTGWSPSRDSNMVVVSSILLSLRNGPTGTTPRFARSREKAGACAVLVEHNEKPES